MGTSWIDFYNQLTSNGQLVNQARSNNFTSGAPFRLNYAASGGLVGGKSKPKKNQSGLDKKLGLLKYTSPLVGLLRC